MLNKLFPWQKGSIVTLVPNSGIQFIDFAVTHAFASALQCRFYAERTSETDAEGRPIETLHEVLLDNENEPYAVDIATGRTKTVAPEDVFSVRVEQALDAMAERWLPVPVLRVREDGRFAEGPWNWARLFITRLPELDADGNQWRVCLALDTLLGEQRPNGYQMPEPRDAAEMAPFGLATAFSDLSAFLRHPWARGWLRDSYLAAETARRGRVVTLESLPRALIYLANYIAMMKAFAPVLDRKADAALGPIVPRIRFIDEAPYIRDRKPIPVTLVIDIGNSRTCGVLIEDGSGGNQRLDMSQAYRLEVRDLSNPSHTYSDPFESRLEFHNTNFNLGAYSKMAGRPIRDAFWWPSPVRVGPEATWLASLTDGTNGSSGLSSPKRYVWDEAERTIPWVNNGGLLPPDTKVPPIRGPITSQLTQKGDRLKPGSLPGLKAAYSRSSLYMLMLTEILTHAITQINAVSTRANRSRRDEPRQLSRVIITLSSATPLAEQSLLKKLITRARDLLWSAMGWDATQPLRKPPELRLDWDEATATHLVYLYNEILQKLQYSPSECFRLLARPQEPAHERPQLRIASIDIGGGTTDLMIIQHEVTDGDRTVLPRQLFREGFRLAGDDIVKQVIEDEVLPCLGKALSAAGISNPSHFLAERFSGDREGMSQQDRTRRALFVNQVLRPAAIALLGQCEATARQPDPEQNIALRLVETFASERPPLRAVLDYVEEAARRAGAPAFALDQVVIETTHGKLAATIRGVVGPILTDLCDVIRSYNCDVLLFSGRPSRLTCLWEWIVGQAPVPPGRVVSMGSYEVGNWYPFHSSSFRIDDPKTTAAVGAMLCHVCEGQVEGLLVRSSEIRMRSTARYIGIMEKNDQLRNERLIFSNIDLDKRTKDRSRTVAVTPPAFIGFRQLPIERWKTTPLYFLDFKDSKAVASLAMPLQVTIERKANSEGDDQDSGEEFEEPQARDANNNDAAVVLTLQTLRVERDQEAGYWLDSGVLAINWRN